MQIANETKKKIGKIPQNSTFKLNALNDNDDYYDYDEDDDDDGDEQEEEQQEEKK